MKKYTYAFTHYYADTDPFVNYGTFDYYTKRSALRAGNRVLRVIRRNTRAFNTTVHVVQVNRDGSIGDLGR